MLASDAASTAKSSSSRIAGVKIDIPKAKVKSWGSGVNATIADPDGEATLSKFNLVHISLRTVDSIAEKLKKTWRSPM